MKIQNIRHLLQAALILLLASCTQEEFTDVQDKERPLTISVTDGGYASSAVDNKSTRAVEKGYTTEFIEGDTCGLFVTRNRKLVYSNVKLTAKRDDASGKLTWKPEEGTTLVGRMDDERYYIYHPYRGDLDEAYLSKIICGHPHDLMNALLPYSQPQTDQSSYAAYTASDLMTGSCTPTWENGTLRIDFEMEHLMALVVIEMPKTIYKFTDTRVPDYTVPSEAQFTSNAKPLRMTDGTYRYLVFPSNEVTSAPLEGSYDDGTKEFSFIPSDFVRGEYSLNSATL